MNNQILFIILNNQIHYSKDNMDHKELYLSLGGDINNYENTIRGIITKDKIVFFKANLSYDQEVIDMACKCSPLIKSQLNNSYLKVYCGINPGQNGSSWEPIMPINDSELTGFTSINNNIDKEKEKERIERINRGNETVVDFKNNYDDPKFVKLATLFTGVMIALTIISKIILVITQSIDITSGWIILLSISQIVLLVVTLIGYIKKIPSAKYIGIGASLSLVFMFSIIDVILGIVNLLFTIDQGYILKAITAGKKATDSIVNKK